MGCDLSNFLTRVLGRLFRGTAPAERLEPVAAEDAPAVRRRRAASRPSSVRHDNDSHAEPTPAATLASDAEAPESRDRTVVGHAPVPATNLAHPDDLWFAQDSSEEEARAPLQTLEAIATQAELVEFAPFDLPPSEDEQRAGPNAGADRAEDISPSVGETDAGDQDAEPGAERGAVPPAIAWSTSPLPFEAPYLDQDHLPAASTDREDGPTQPAAADLPGAVPWGEPLGSDQDATSWETSEWWQDPFPRVETELVAEPLPDWADIDLDEPEAEPATVDPAEPQRVVARAVRLAELLTVMRGDAASKILQDLRSLLREFPHGSSHLAIERLVIDGTAWTDLQDIAELIRFWRSDPMLWARRRFDPLRREWIVWSDASVERLAFGWRRAASAIAIIEREQAEAWIAGDWLAAWHRLRPAASGFGSYAQFVDLQVRSLAEGPDAGAADFDEGEAADEWAWRSRIDPELSVLVARDGRHPVPVGAPADSAGFSCSTLAPERW